MRLKIILKIALKNLWSHRLRTILTIAGVTIGIASIIFLVSLGYGLEKLVTSQVADFEAFTVLDVPSANISNVKIDDKSIEKIQSFGHVNSVAPVTNLAGRINKQGDLSTAETVVTGASDEYWKLANITIDKGHLPQQSDEIVINKAVAGMLGEETDSLLNKTLNLKVIIPPELRTNSSDGLKNTESVPLKVTGISTEEQAPVVFVDLTYLVSQDAAKYSSLKIKVDGQDNVEALRKQLENNGFSTEYIGDTVNQISQVFSMFRAILAAFGLIALIVAALGTFNTLTISLLERTREIGLFKALGMRNKDVYKLFLSESLVIGGLGGIVGLVLGWLMGKGIDLILTALAARSNAEPINLFATPIIFALGVAIFSLIVGFLTGWYPSKRAVKIDPLDALKYE